jgi:hypothetical protein
LRRRLAGDGRKVIGLSWIMQGRRLAAGSEKRAACGFRRHCCGHALIAASFDLQYGRILARIADSRSRATLGS